MSSPRKRVLIIDDDDDSRDLMQALVAGLGFDALQAANADEALAQAASGGIDVVLIDLGMPEVDGFEVARRLRATLLGARARLVALTGYSDAASRQCAADAGFDAYLVKPARSDAIAALLS